MSRKIIPNYTCPFCNESVYSLTDVNFEYSQTKRGTKQYFHRTCYYENNPNLVRIRNGKEKVIC